jgi:hypothetical protein
MKEKRRHKKRVYVCYYCLFMRMRRGYDSSLFFPYYNLMSTKYVLPVQTLSSLLPVLSIIYLRVPFSLFFSLSLFLLFNTWCRFGIRRNIIIILLSLHHSYLFFPILGMQQSSSVPFTSLLYLFFLKREVI